MADKTVLEIFGLTPVKPFKSKLTDTPFCSAPEHVMGAELETENIRQGHDGLAGVLSKGFEITTDNSLRGSAYEFVTRPMRQATLLSELENFFKVTGFTKDNYTDRCSVHIHANVQDYTEAQLRTLFLLYTTIEDVLFTFVNSDLPEGVGERDSNLYCVPWSQCRMNRNLISSLFNRGAAASFSRWQKYTALNLIPITTYGTVEFRHMYGTSDMKKLATWVNLIGALMRFSKETSYEDVVSTIKILNDVSTYERYYTAVLGSYLPYDERFRQSLYSGVVNAKLSLFYVNEKDVKEGTKSITEEQLEEVLLRERQGRNLNIALERLRTTIAPTPRPRQDNRAVFDEALMPGPYGEGIRALPETPEVVRFNAGNRIRTRATARVEPRVIRDLPEGVHVGPMGIFPEETVPGNR